MNSEQYRRFWQWFKGGRDPVEEAIYGHIRANCHISDTSIRTVSRLAADVAHLEAERRVEEACKNEGIRNDSLESENIALLQELEGAYRAVEELNERLESFAPRLVS